MEPVPAEIDWTPDGVSVIYASDPEWWVTRRAIREMKAKDVPE